MIRGTNMNKKKKSAALYVNIVLAVIIAGLYLTLVSPYAMDAVATSGLPIYKGSSKDCVALQCTVTWDAAAIPSILDLLKERDLRITFAVSGEWAERNGGMLSRMAAEGHEIATLGYSPTLEGGLSSIKSDLKRSINAIKSVTGSAPQLFCCSGRNSSICARAASQFDLTPVMCTLDLVCANGTANDILTRVIGNTNGGDILLVSPTAAFAQALPDILDYLASEELTVASVSSTIYS